MKIFLTGATGVIGRRLVPLLADDAHEVTAIGRTSKGRADGARWLRWAAAPVGSAARRG